MELQVVKLRKKSISEKSVEEVIPVVEVEEIVQHERRPFIEANTSVVTLQHLKNDCTIPVFSRDNECTIAHSQFIETVKEAASKFFNGHAISEPDIKVSHVIKGRTPEAIGKAAKDLLDHERTIYYERMAFMMTIPSITEIVNGNRLSISIGGVRAYNHENLYAKKNVEKFKVFVGFQNFVCTNLCISTDGYSEEIRVGHVGDLLSKVTELLQAYDIQKHIQDLNDLGKYQLTEHQFAQLIGKAKLYNYLPSQEKRLLPEFEFTDTQISCVAKDYYQDGSFCKESDGSINLWKCYNLFTGANKSSYIDNFLSRTVNAYTFTKGIEQALKGVSNYNWFLI